METPIRIENVKKSLNGILTYLKKRNVTSKEIAIILKKLKGIPLKMLYALAIENKEIELAKKIKEALKIIKIERIKAFEIVVQTGNKAEFLNSLSLGEKVELKSDIAKIKNNTLQKEKYLKILEEDISKELEHFLKTKHSKEEIARLK